MGWYDDALESEEYFNSLVAPRLERFFDGKISSQLNSKLDEKSGVDYLLETSEGVYGIASRVQYDTNYYTFTVREARLSGSSTELEKRLKSINNHSIYPVYTVQAYVDRKNRTLLSFAVCRTEDLFDLIQKYNPPRRSTGYNQQGQAIFRVVGFMYLPYYGYWLYMEDTNGAGEFNKQ